MEVSDPGDLTQRVCRKCGTSHEGRLYPALFRKKPEEIFESKLVAGSDASCFHHPAKQAEVACESCGRFLCSVCDIPFEGKHLCSSCFSSERDKGNFSEWDAERKCPGSIALFFVIVSFLIPWFALIVIPGVILYVCMNWKAKGSIVRTSKWRLVLALVLVLIQFLVYGSFIVVFIVGFIKGFFLRGLS